MVRHLSGIDGATPVALAERILSSVNRVLAGDDDAVMAADSFGRDAALFGRVLDGMLNGNTVLGITKVTDY